MSKTGYKKGKRSYSSKDNSFNSKVMRAVYNKEYLDSIDDGHINPKKAKQHEVTKKTTKKKVVKKRSGL